MKKMIGIAVFLVLQCLWTLSAQADISGKWDGTGEWTYDGSTVPCGMTLSFSETASEFKRLGGYYDCNYVGMHSDPLTWKKQGTQLIGDDGSVVGSITPTMIQFKEFYSENVSIDTSIAIADKHFSYHEIWYDQGQLLYDITGEFDRK